ncbi:MAG: 50S ribosomal protein L21 [Patescibacteria group bacterium]
MALFAIIETGGKQYAVKKGDIIKVEKLGGKAASGETVVFDKVLLIDDGAKAEIGIPYITGKSVEGLVKSEGRARKISVMKYKAKSRYRKVRGHRQPFTEVEITEIK